MRLAKPFIYELKQTLKQWYKKFDKVIQSNGFLVNDFGKCVYLKYFNGACVILCLYAYNILILGKILKIIKEKKNLCSNFDMKDLRITNVILGIKFIKI